VGEFPRKERMLWIELLNENRWRGVEMNEKRGEVRCVIALEFVPFDWCID